MLECIIYYTHGVVTGGKKERNKKQGTEEKEKTQLALWSEYLEIDCFLALWSDYLEKDFFSPLKVWCLCFEDEKEIISTPCS